MRPPADTTVKETAGGGEAADAPEDEDRRRKRKIAVTLATLLVLGAGLTILQTDASIKESNSARETTRVAVRAMSANVVARPSRTQDRISRPRAASCLSVARSTRASRASPRPQAYRRRPGGQPRSGVPRSAPFRPLAWRRCSPRWR